MTLAASGLAKSYGSRRLFSDVSLHLNPGRRVALVGGNGTGKTTLLEIMAGLADPDEGTVTKPRDARIGYLPQDLREVSDGTVHDQVVAGAGDLAELARKLHALEAQLEHAGGRDHDHCCSGVAGMPVGSGTTRERRRARPRPRCPLRRGSGPSSSSSADMRSRRRRPRSSPAWVSPAPTPSGPWPSCRAAGGMRVSLARLLLSKPDILLLDEPTNHLDVDSMAWLERRLAQWPGALLFVSHDRDFIDAVADRIVELSEGTTIAYEGAFAEFVVARTERLQRLEAAAARQRREVARVERFVERFRYKATKARQVQSRIKTLQKLERIEGSQPRRSRRPLRLRCTSSIQPGRGRTLRGHRRLSRRRRPRGVRCHPWRWSGARRLRWWDPTARASRRC